MQHHPLVSLIVSCYNCGKYVRQTLESLINQTYSNLEIIVVDDGSTDNSAEVIKSFKDERIKYFYQHNRGQCAALNSGFRQSKGVFIKFYDADDILHHDAIAGQVEALENAGPYDMGFIEWRRFYNNEVPSSIDASHPHTIHKDCTPVEYINNENKPPMYQCGLWLIPRTLIEKGGLWNEQLSLINDTEYFPRLLSHTKKLYFSDRGYTLYRVNFKSSTLSSDNSVKGIKSAIKAIDLAAVSYLKMENSERMRNVIVQSYNMFLEGAYPKHKIYSTILESRIKQYGKKVQMRQSGKVYNWIMKIFGWKVARRMSLMYYRLLYNKS